MMNSEITNELKNKALLVINKLQAYAFWILITTLIGVWIGIVSCNKIKDSKMEEAIQLGGMVYKGKVFSITTRLVQ